MKTWNKSEIENILFSLQDLPLLPYLPSSSKTFPIENWRQSDCGLHCKFIMPIIMWVNPESSSLWSSSSACCLVSRSSKTPSLSSNCLIGLTCTTFSSFHFHITLIRCSSCLWSVICLNSTPHERTRFFRPFGTRFRSPWNKSSSDPPGEWRHLGKRGEGRKNLDVQEAIVIRWHSRHNCSTANEPSLWQFTRWLVHGSMHQWFGSPACSVRVAVAVVFERFESCHQNKTRKRLSKSPKRESFQFTFEINQPTSQSTNKEAKQRRSRRRRRQQSNGKSYQEQLIFRWRWKLVLFLGCGNAPFLKELCLKMVLSTTSSKTWTIWWQFLHEFWKRI